MLAFSDVIDQRGNEEYDVETGVELDEES